MFALAGMMGALVATPIAVYATHVCVGCARLRMTYRDADDLDRYLSEFDGCLRPSLGTNRRWPYLDVGSTTESTIATPQNWGNITVSTVPGAVQAGLVLVWSGVV